MFVYRTLKILIVLLKTDLLVWSNNWAPLFRVTLLKLWKSQFFMKAITGLLKTVWKTPRVFHASNILKSTQYCLLSEASLLLTNQFTFRTKTPLFNQNSLNLYFKPLTISNISLHNKTNVGVMMNFLLLLLHNWAQFNKYFDMTFRFMVITPELRLLRCYNVYLFKVFNF